MPKGVELILIARARRRSCEPLFLAWSACEVSDAERRAGAPAKLPSGRRHRPRDLGMSKSVMPQGVEHESQANCGSVRHGSGFVNAEVSDAERR